MGTISSSCKVYCDWIAAQTKEKTKKKEEGRKNFGNVLVVGLNGNTRNRSVYTRN